MSIDMASTQQWGVTPPVSMTFPTEADLAINDALVQELKSQNNFEGPEETRKRLGPSLNTAPSETLLKSPAGQSY